MLVYFDNAAAARPADAVLDFYRRALAEDYANQEAAHSLGFDLRKKLEDAARRLSHALTGRGDYGVVWGGSGTELFNLIADSPLVAGRKVLTTELEHPALAAALRRSAANVVYEGPADFAATFAVQSEVGLIQDTGAFYAAAFGAVRMLDAVQAAGKLPVPEADLTVVSGHKFGAPGGAAILLHPAWPGRRKFLEFAHAYRHTAYRAGRPEAPQMLAMAFAAESCSAGQVPEINAFLRAELGKYCTLQPEKASPYILHLMLPGVETGVLVRMLAGQGVMVSAGSACSSESKEPSAVLRKLGFSRRDAWSGLRVSFSGRSTLEEAKKFLEALRAALKNY